ncbi:MAG: hypothetical protein MZV64_56345 [Ignavibacteriales bacterium]|nr:hypothetical protein [Ignavibacteriales bacterium]
MLNLLSQNFMLLEEKYGGLIIGTVRSIRERKKRAEVAKQSAKMLSFKSGMIALTKSD